MTERVFVDTNILIYAASDDPSRSDDARAFLLKDSEFHISTQVINEFIAACQKKNILSRSEIERTVEEYLSDFSLHLISDSTIRSALKIQTGYLFSYWDALIVASALEAECSFLLTEDLQQDLLINKLLKIQNPFVST